MLSTKPYLKEVQLKDNSEIDRNQYPFNIPSIRDFSSMDFHPDVTFIVGENGSGKSTLVEAIAVMLGFSQEGGTRNMRSESASTVSALRSHLRPIRGASRPSDGYFLRAESLYSVSTYMDVELEGYYLDAYGGTSMHNRSHGELFFTTLTKKFRGNGLYIMDEPEAALSPNRQMAALTAIHDLVKRDSQFIIATHSPILLAYPRAKILKLDETGIHEVAYEETEHFSVTRQFLNNYRGMLEILLEKQLELPLD